MGNFLEILTNYNKKLGTNDREVELQRWLNAVDKLNTKKRLSPDLIEAIEKHFDYFWKEYRVDGINLDDPILLNLPKETKDYVDLNVKRSSY